MWGRRRRTLVEPIRFKDTDPAEEAPRLRRLTGHLAEQVRHIQSEAFHLREELAAARGDPRPFDGADERVPGLWLAGEAARTLDPAAEVASLDRLVEVLTGEIEFLWSDVQFLRAQLAVEIEKRRAGLEQVSGSPPAGSGRR